ncbi:mitochondrial distribution and morphology proteins-domain-containing protein [Flagelloscypha sp. PMI_526]|nr:mitochondrial distribution and morphology proteins-domain-containing protein [Flagelloscypha sp. PMI_526]
MSSLRALSSTRAGLRLGHRTISKRIDAMADRYMVIRSFFHNQTTPPPIRISTPSLFVPVSRQCSLQARKFHASARRHATDKPDPVSQPPKPPPSPPPSYENYSNFFRRLAQSVPHGRSPTRDDLLQAATGFWERLHVRLKWLTIRSFRRFNADDISAFVTWFIFSQAVWIFVGTTTFVSVIFATLNSLSLQNDVARAISRYLSELSGVHIAFESAVVPKWKDSRISFKNVYVSRRPASQLPSRRFNDEHTVAAGYDVSNHPGFHRFVEEEEPVHPDDEDWNFTMFDLVIDSVDVTLSLAQWFDGKGLVKDAVVKGVRGVMDCRHLTYDPENPLIPADFRHPSAPGDFELDSLQVEDMLVTVLHAGGFRPFTASIFRADIKTFRKRWLFYDLLNADNIVGQFDNCLISLHRPQSIGRTTEKDLADGEWSRMSRIRIDGVNVDHVQRATEAGGPVSWIRSGQVDVVFDIKFPHETEGIDLNELIEDLADAISTSIATRTADPLVARIPGQRELLRPPISAPEEEGLQALSEPTPKVVVDVDLRFRDIKADLPIFTRDISYVNNALARPIVAFMNANRTLVPIRCRIVKELSDFDGAWTAWETGLLDEISDKIYEALAYHVTQANMNGRIRHVGLWSLQMTAQAVLNALRSAVEPTRGLMMNIYELGSPFEMS